MKKATIYYARMDEFYRKEEKYLQLEKLEHIQNVDWQVIKPDKENTWLTEGLEDEFNDFFLIGSKELKHKMLDNPEVIFKMFSLGIASNRDEWVFSFDIDDLKKDEYIYK